MVTAAAQEHSEPEGLFQRMTALVRLTAVVGPTEPRRSMLDGILRQMRLFARMTMRLGVAPPKSPLTFAVLREAEVDCMECEEWQRCRHWLDGTAPGDEPNAFCPNHALFKSLPRESGGMPPPEPRA